MSISRCKKSTIIVSILWFYIFFLILDMIVLQVFILFIAIFFVFADIVFLLL